MGGKPKPWILVVDDNHDLADNIAEVLALAGLPAAVASSAEEALPKAAAVELSVLITDYRLPGMNGADLVRTVRGRRRDIDAIVMSAFTDERTIADAKAAGAEFIAKPVDVRELLSRFAVGRAPAA
jgi:DNA-binding response OmpR family regulator